MTDRERLLEQVKELETLAGMDGLMSRQWLKVKAISQTSPEVVRYARSAAHHALTALALRDVVAIFDEGLTERPWHDPPPNASA